MSNDKIKPVKYISRVLEMIVCRQGDPIYGELVTKIKIDDEAAGEFIKIIQERGGEKERQEIEIDREEWPIIRDVINKLVGSLQD